MVIPVDGPCSNAQVQAQAQKRTQQAVCTTKQPQSAPRKRSRTDPAPKCVGNVADLLCEPRSNPTHAATSGQPEANMAQTFSNMPSLGQATAGLRKPGPHSALPPSTAASCPATALLRAVPSTSIAAAQQPSSSVQDPAHVLEVPTFMAPAEMHVDDSSRAAIHAAIEPPRVAHVLKSTGECLGAFSTEEVLLHAPPDTVASSSASSSSSSVPSMEDAASAQIIAPPADRPQHDAASDTSEEDSEEAQTSTAVPLSESGFFSDDDAGSHTSEVDGFVKV